MLSDESSVIGRLLENKPSILDIGRMRRGVFRQPEQPVVCEIVVDIGRELRAGVKPRQKRPKRENKPKHRNRRQ